MADINVERKSPGIWPWILGLVALALLIWALAALLGGDDEAELAAIDPVATEVAEVEPAVPPAETLAPVAGARVPVSQIIESPATWTGRTVGGEVRVVEVPTDRGFWIEDQGERLFVILRDAPAERPIDINPGQTIRMSEATVYDNVANVPGEVDADTRDIAQGLPVFLGIDEANIEMLQPAGA